MSLIFDTFATDYLPAPQALPTLTFGLDGLVQNGAFNITHALMQGALDGGHGNRPCLIDASQTLTYAQVNTRINQWCHVFTEDLGLVRGNRVLLRGANSPAYAVALLAVWKCGLVAVPTMPQLRSADLVVVWQKAQVQAAVCDAGLMQDVQDCLAQLSSNASVLDMALDVSHKPLQFEAAPTLADEVCHIAFTSGTTGVPKGAMHFHRDLYNAGVCFSRHVLRPKAADRFMGTPPLAFTFGLGGLLLFALDAGASTVLLPSYTPESLLQAVQAHHATTLFTAPTFYRLMTPLVNKESVPSLHTCVSAGEALPKATRGAWEAATGLVMLDGIGATEMFHIFIAASGADVRAGATGKVVPGYEATIVNEQGAQVPRGTVGRLAVRGPTGCKYLDDARQASYVQGGWNFTGDAYIQDAEGYFWYQARTDDMIISAGYNIGAPEVESALLMHASVAECAVVGVPDETRGQIVKAFVVLRSGVDASEATITALQDHVKATIAPYKYPRQIAFVSELPKTNTGKLQRFKLKQDMDSRLRGNDGSI